MIKNFKYKTILSYGWKCKKNAESMDSILKTNNVKTMLLSRFMK